MSKNLGKAVKKGLAWKTLARVLSEVIRFGGSVVLARLLDPIDFGIMGIATLVTSYVKRFRSFGFGMAIIQKKDVTEEHMHAVFWANFGIGVLIFAGILLASSYIGDFFNSPLSGIVVAVVSVVFLINPFSSVQNSILQRQLRFKVLSIMDFVEDFLSLGVTITMAFMGYGVWSLVAGKVGSAVIRILMLIPLTRWMPRFRYNARAMKDIFSFGLWVFIRTQLNYFADNIDYFVIGKALGPTALGFYERSFNTMRLPQKRIYRGADPVLFSAFSRIQDKLDRIRSGFRKSLLAISLLNVPFMVGMALIAPSFVVVAFGEKWIPMIPSLEILCMAGIFLPFANLLRSINTAQGYVKENTIVTGVAVAVLLIGCIFGSRWGIEGVAVAVFVHSVLITVLMFDLLRRTSGIRWRDFVEVQVPAIVPSVIMVLAVRGFQMWASRYFTVYSAQMLFFSAALGAVVYVGTHLLVRFQLVSMLVSDLLSDLRPALQNALRSRRIAFLGAGRAPEGTSVKG